MKFLKTGKAAKQAMQEEKTAAEQRQKEKIFRYWMKQDTDGAITFLDGNLDEELGILDTPMFREHNLNLSGKWGNYFTCIAEEEPCPICEGGDSPYFAQVFTIIDHRKWEDKKKTVHKDELKLFVAKPKTVELLTKLAQKRGGLAGCRFDVSRTGDNSASVGSLFDFDEKADVDAICKKYKVEGPLNYEEVITAHTGQELRDMGFGSTQAGAESGSAVDDDDL